MDLCKINKLKLPEDLLSCPLDKSFLSKKNGLLVCNNNHNYYCFHNIPVMLLQDQDVTHEECSRSLKIVQGQETLDYLSLLDESNLTSGIDPCVQRLIAGTCGRMWIPLINKLKEYPIPEFPLDNSNCKTMLDIGCSWGRWSISAAKKGFITFGIDHSLESILAARRVARQVGVEVYYLVGDSRYLPFKDNSFDYVFSYSVLQHFSKENVFRTLKEISRVLKPGGISLIQMPNKFGFRNIFNQLINKLKKPDVFDVRYWTIGELKNVFSEFIGETYVFSDAFFNLNPDVKNVRFLPVLYKLVVHLSELLKYFSNKFSFLMNLADSVYVRSISKKK